LKDEFNDFEEQKLLTPVREEALILLIQISHNPILKEEMDFIVTNLPQILKIVESGSWKHRYNFFLLMKGMSLYSKS